ncbi:HlyD family efflux transporter periplasmic adaptor subunit [Alteromonas sp. ASW11-130]|uniref:HlyD family efflux transporter periplasmic adaptor subunit n=1 Tax=Alteromonas sp. ASW11-130 TaxID=3015775 RepID=UPI002242164E|nr:HlyD family efflux transporter periplasmic adaptor subunit [Alteromonas sp. ASW11-130]MCW8092664.1 HlyD family efflux transporter periplasmic adaptor subunit [Alteromonas sp. ASW11-130]
MKLHNKKSMLRTAPHSPPPRKKTPIITQWLYIIFLIGICLYVLYFILKQAFTIQTTGVIESQSLVIKSPYSGLLTMFETHQSQLITRGDIVGIVSPEETCEPEDNTKDERLLHYRIQEARLALQLLIDEHQIDQREFDRLRAQDRKLKRALEVNAPLNNDSDKLRVTLAKQEAEIKMQRAKINLLEKRYQELTESTRLIQPARCRPRSIVAAQTGTVSTVAVMQGDAVKAGETLLTLTPQNPQLTLTAYLEVSEFDELKIGDTLTIVLPDDSNSSGRVAKITSSASGLDKLEYDDYRPVLPQLKVILTPTTDAEAQRWARFDKFQVLVEGVQ